MRGGRRRSGQIDDIVHEICYNRLGKKMQEPDMVGRMQPMVQGHATGMVDRVVTVIRLERLGMLEVEDKVRRGRRACGGTRLITVAKNLTSSSFLAHTGGCAVWWGWMS